MRPQSSVVFGETYLQAQDFGQNYVFNSYWARVMLAPTSTRPQEREFVVDSGASMHMMSKKDLNSDELDSLRRSKNPLWCLQPMGKCIQTRKHKYTLTTKIYSWQCNYSKKRLLFYRLESCAQSTGVHMSGKTVKLHDWPKMGRQLLVQSTTTYGLLFQYCPPIQEAVHRQRRH